MITDVINKVQSEASSEASAVDNPFSKVKELITDLIDKVALIGATAMIS